MCSDFADAAFQIDYAGVGNTQRRIPLVVIGLPQHAIDALRDGLNDVVAAIARLARVGRKNHARRGFAAVAHQLGERNAQAFQNMRHGFQAALRFESGGLHVGLSHHSPPPARASRGGVLCVILVAVSGASGGSPNWRKLPAITCAKTGPATLPP